MKNTTIWDTHTLSCIVHSDGTFQTSFVPNPVHTSKGVIYHRGDRIVRAAIAEFSTNATIGLSQATDVVISGCSAGGARELLLHLHRSSLNNPSTLQTQRASVARNLVPPQVCPRFCTSTCGRLLSPALRWQRCPTPASSSITVVEAGPREILLAK